MTMPDPSELATAVDFLLGQKLLADPGDLYRRLTTLEDTMATVAEQAADIIARLLKVDADITRRDEAQAELTERVAALEAELATRVPEAELAELLEPVKAAVAALDERTPEPVVEPAPVEG